MGTVLSACVVLVMVAGLLMIPLGLPGLWLLGAVLFGVALWGRISWTFALIGVVAAGLAELGEFLVLRSLGKKYGASRKAFWGAVLGGMAGLFVGVPIPLVGSLLTAFLGTFVGAGLVTFFETRSLARSATVGWGVLLARTLAVGLKVAVGMVILGSTAIALFF